MWKQNKKQIKLKTMQTTETTRKAHIQFGTDEDAVIHVINWSDLNEYLGMLKENGWDLNKVDLIKVTD